MNELKEKLESTEKRLLVQRQKHDLKVLTETHEKELHELTHLWDQQLRQYKETCASNEEEMKARQADEYRNERDRLEHTVPVIPVHNKDIEKTKKLQEALVKKKKYKEANNMQRNIDTLSHDRPNEWVGEKQGKICLLYTSPSPRDS